LYVALNFFCVFLLYFLLKELNLTQINYISVQTKNIVLPLPMSYARVPCRFWTQRFWQMISVWTLSSDPTCTEPGDRSLRDIGLSACPNYQSLTVTWKQWIFFLWPFIIVSVQLNDIDNGIDHNGEFWKKRWPLSPASSKILVRIARL
jgi:hypothetical protein